LGPLITNFLLLNLLRVGNSARLTDDPKHAVSFSERKKTTSRITRRTTSRITRRTTSRITRRTTRRITRRIIKRMQSVYHREALVFLPEIFTGITINHY